MIIIKLKKSNDVYSYFNSSSSIISVLPKAPAKFAPSKLDVATKVRCVGSTNSAESALVSH